MNSIGVMDYSLLLGVHHTEYDVSEDAHLKTSLYSPALQATHNNTFSPSSTAALAALTGNGQYISTNEVSIEGPLAAGEALSLSAVGGVSMIRRRASTVTQVTTSTASSSAQAVGAIGGSAAAAGGVVVVGGGSDSSNGNSDIGALLSFSSSSAADRGSGDTDAYFGVSLSRRHEVNRIVGPDCYYMGIIDYQQVGGLLNKIFIY